MEVLRNTPGRGETRVNIIVVPGVHAKKLGDQTCSHFEKEFVEELVRHQRGPTTVRLFKHDLRFEDLKAWDLYCYMGEKLLDQMKELVAHGLHDPEQDSFLLLGHKLGVFILKTALIIADQQGERSILDSIDLLMLFGDPQLTPDNRSEWIKLIESCCCSQKIPKPLSLEKSVECLQEISERFERITFHSSLLEVGSKSRTPERLRDRLRRRKHPFDRCIKYPEIKITKDTTQGDQDQLEPQNGDTSACAFSNSSAHFRNLIEASDTTVFATIQPRSSLQHLLARRLSCSEDKEPEAIADNDTSPIIKPDLRVTQSASDTLVSENNSQETCDNDALSDVRSATDSPSIFSAEDDLQEDDASSSPSSKTEAYSDDVISEVKDSSSDVNDEELPTSTRPRSDLTTEVKRNDVFNMPFTLPRIAIGQEELTEQMNKFFHSRSDLSSSNCSLQTLSAGGLSVLLQGMPGVGKSCLALSYGSTFRANYDMVARIRADSLLTMGQDYRSLALNLGLVQKTSRQSHTQTRSIVNRWLEQTSTSWLLIFDDCNEKAMLRDCLTQRPISVHGHCIITTRFEDRIDHLTESKNLLPLQVEPLGVDAALRLFSTLAPGACEELDSSDIKSLVRHCGGFPLALETVARFTSRKGFTYSEVNRFLNRFGANNEQSPLVIRHTTDRTFPSANLLAIQEAMRKSLSASASAVIAVVAFFDADVMDESFIWNQALPDSARLRFYPKTREEFLSVRSELWHHGACEVYTESALSRFWQHSYWHRSWVLQEIALTSLDHATFVKSFHTASQSLLSRWPKARKLGNIASGYWPEFNMIHRHTQNISKIISSATGLGVQDKMTWTLNRRAALPELLSGSFLQLLQLSLWYNSVLGNGDEDENLHLLLEDLIRFSNSQNSCNIILPAYATVSAGRTRHRLQCEHIDSMARHSTINWHWLTSTPSRPSTISRHACVPYSLVDMTNLDECYWVKRPKRTDSCPSYIAILDYGKPSDREEVEETPSIVASGGRFAISALPALQKEFLICTRLSGIRYAWIDTICLDQRNKYTPLWHCSQAVVWKPETVVRQDNSTHDLGRHESISINPPVQEHVRDAKPTLVPTSSDIEDNLAASKQAIKLGIEAAISQNFALAGAQLCKARDMVSTFQQPTPGCLEVVICATVYLIHVYCEQKLFEVAQDALDRLDQVMKLQSESFQCGSIQKGHLALIRGRIRQHTNGDGIPIGEVTAQYLEAVEMFQACDSKDMNVADLLALSQVKLAEAYLINAEHQLAHSFSQLAISHWQDRVGILEEGADENGAGLPEEPQHQQSAPLSEDNRINGAITTLDAVQAQLGRALMVKALIYEAEPKMRLARSALAAARATLEDLEEQRSMQTSDTDMWTNDQNGKEQTNRHRLEDFTTAIREFWLR